MDRELVAKPIDKVRAIAYTIGVGQAMSRPTSTEGDTAMDEQIKQAVQMAVNQARAPKNPMSVARIIEVIRAMYPDFSEVAYAWIECAVVNAQC